VYVRRDEVAYGTYVYTGKDPRYIEFDAEYAYDAEYAAVGGDGGDDESDACEDW
jgi:hypothetical protein